MTEEKKSLSEYTDAEIQDEFNKRMFKAIGKALENMSCKKAQNEEKEKSISEMTNEEILRKQLELLAEQSEKASFNELPALTHAMIEIFSSLCCLD